MTILLIIHRNTILDDKYLNIYSSSHNHGSVENGCISNITFLPFID